MSAATGCSSRERDASADAVGKWANQRWRGEHLTVGKITLPAKAKEREDAERRARARARTAADMHAVFAPVRTWCKQAMQ
eukprot:216477-Chlamydomonas_euryale.AAC.1